MADRPDDPPTQFLEEVAAVDLPVHKTDPITPPFAEISTTERRHGTFVDWRTIDPATIEGDHIPVEELRYFREKIDEMLKSWEGQYVLILGRQIIRYSEDLESLARHAEMHFRDRTFLIKRVVRFEPVHTAGGVAG